MKKINEDGEGGVGIGDIGSTGDSGMSTDIITGGSDVDQTNGILGYNNFSFPVRFAKIKKRLLSKYHLLNKK